MEFEYRYKGNSSARSSATDAEMSLKPDLLREPTYFRGELGHSIAFREAISALHDVVISDLRTHPKDRSEYKAWREEQNAIDMDLVLAQRDTVKKRLEEINEELKRLRHQSRDRMREFYASRQEYFDYIYTRDYDAWLVLDPVVTVHPDEVFFECFSKDESSYGRLGVEYDVFKEIDTLACGTTNVDYSDGLYDAFQKIRTYKSTHLEVDPSGFEVETTYEEAHREVKIDLPESWVRGFLQVNAAMTLPMTTVVLDPMDVHNICFVLRGRKARESPRAMRYVLEPGRPVRIIFEPWDKEIVCTRSIYRGDEPRDIRVWGRRRLLILERLIPQATSFTVHLLGTGMPSFYVAKLGGMSFTLGLSGWTRNDWSRSGNFDLMAPRAQVDSSTAKRLFDALKSSWYATPRELVGSTNLDRATVLAGLGIWAQEGRAMFDLNKGVYRVRELSREPLPMAQLRFANEREEEATTLVEKGAVSSIHLRDIEGGGRVVSGAVRDKRSTHDVEIEIDPDERLNQGSCHCSFYIQNRMRKGPCAHMLALRMGAERDRETGVWARLRQWVER